PEIHAKDTPAGRRFYLVCGCNQETKNIPADRRGVVLAVAERITGPYRVLTPDGPLIAGNDADLFTDDDGQDYLFLAGVRCVRVDLEHGKILGEPWTCIGGGAPEDWDTGPGVGREGPEAIKIGDTYYCFYSSWGRGYEVGYATAKDLHGPWTKGPENPIYGAQSEKNCQRYHKEYTQAADVPYSEVGHGQPFVGPDGKWWISAHFGQKVKSPEAAGYHGWEQPGYDPLVFVDGVFKRTQPTWTPQSVPLPDAAPAGKLSAVDAYDYVVGTQTIGAAYGFTAEPRLVETARAIREMGASVIKFQLSNTAKDPAVRTLADMAARDPATRTVLDMPFADYVLWAYADGAKDDPFNPARLPEEYRQIHDLTRDLLARYRGTGKTFYLGNWEGDWHLLHTNPDYVPGEEETRRMVDWVNTRQRAVDDAKRETAPDGVNVFYYLEANRVADAMAGRPRVANTVLPHTPVDYVSYSSYDAIHGDIEADLPRALDYLAAQMPPKPGVPAGRRVFIGEYGFPSIVCGPERQDALSRRVLRTALRWGCPFALYWEMYNNEVKDGVQQGYWLVDDHGTRQPVYDTHRRFLEQARAYVAGFLEREGRVPTREEFGQAAPAWLDGTAEQLKPR
ncbi:glycoside hydrolase family 43 protein, partial [Jatrophihabitans endophyticus]|uniref:glycoside hydrolase family 43 protein n=1 Tax=Jatrophihabitans endophyticus TaxID=1206085 RepID=UPI0019E3FD10